MDAQISFVGNVGESASIPPIGEAIAWVITLPPGPSFHLGLGGKHALRKLERRSYTRVCSSTLKRKNSSRRTSRSTPSERRSTPKLAVESSLPPSASEGATNTTEADVKEKKIWTINTGGLPGLWRLLFLMEATKKQHRPVAIHAQEIQCSLEEWKATLGRISFLGYTGYASTTVTQGTKCKGVLSLISNQVNSKMCDEFYNKRGYAAIALHVQDVLMINSYCPPVAGEIHQHAIEFEEMLIRLDWQGPLLLCGDWNQEPQECLISALSSMFGCAAVDTCEESSRWNGHKLIDFFTSNIPRLSARALGAKISDHKIMETALELELSTFNVQRFKNGANFEKPLWLGAKKWEQLISQAFEIEKANNWQHACHLADDGMPISSQIDDQDQDQEIVDFTWRLTMSKCFTVYQTAYKLALLCIPDHFDNHWEIRKVEKLANRTQTTGSMWKSTPGISIHPSSALPWPDGSLGINSTLRRSS